MLCRKRKRTSFDKQVAHVAKYPLLPACGPCQLRCADKFIQEERECINRQYWRCTFGERRAGLDSHISIYPVKRRRHGRKDTTAGGHSLTCTLPKQVSKVLVCKVMFLCTLGLRTDGTITEFMKAKQRSPEDNVTPIADNRGKSTPPNKLDHGVIRDHINSFNPQVSHYNMEHAPKRQYLESNLSIRGEPYTSIECI